jgi:hypothetical protein
VAVMVDVDVTVEVTVAVGDGVKVVTHGSQKTSSMYDQVQSAPAASARPRAVTVQLE